MLARRLGEASEILLLLARKDPACEEGSRALHSAQLQLVTGGSLSLLTLLNQGNLLSTNTRPGNGA